MALKDIASELGISISTVSRVLNNPDTSCASKELKKKIREAARLQGYAPNVSARNLKKKEAASLATMKPIYCLVACEPLESNEDPFFIKLLNSIEHEAFKNNYILRYTLSTLDIADNTFMRIVSETPSDCLIILGRFKPDLFQKLNKTFKKIIYVGLNKLDVNCDQIICSGYDMTQELVQYLYKLNHRAIGFIGNPEGRYRGYADAMAALNLPIPEDAVIDNVFLSMEGGYQGMLRLLEQSPSLTAVICSNDMVSIGALRACKERGRKVPQDISIIGMNDIETIQYTSPMLSSVHVPLEEMGSIAAKMIFDRINGGHTHSLTVNFPFYLVKRESCRMITLT